jgi:hypothetical protein
VTSKTRPFATCAFCGEPGASDEHVFAEWISKLVGAPPAGWRVSKSSGRTTDGLRYLNVKTRAACRPCNTGWMSRLEQRAASLLIPIIQGRPTTWTRLADQVTVSAWVFKTAMTFDRSFRPPYTSPDEHPRYLFANHLQPPGSVQISLGHYVPEAGDDARPVWGGNARLTIHDDRFTEPAYRITFNVGHAIFLVHGLPGVENEGYEYGRGVFVGGEQVPDAFRRLWPFSWTPYEWPPRGFRFNTAALDHLEGPLSESRPPAPRP